MNTAFIFLLLEKQRQKERALSETSLFQCGSHITLLGNEGMTQAVECLSTNCETLNSQPSTTKPNKQKRKEKQMTHHVIWLSLAKFTASHMSLLIRIKN
jgi:hypothetical protein